MNISIEIAAPDRPMSWRDLLDLIDTLAPRDHRVPITDTGPIVYANRFGVIEIDLVETENRSCA